MCDMQDKIILLDYTIWYIYIYIYIYICTITLTSRCIHWRTRKYIIVDYNWLYHYVTDYVTMWYWSLTRQKLDNNWKFLVCCINLNINENIYLTFYCPGDMTNSIKEKGTQQYYVRKCILLLIVCLCW